MHAVKPFPLCNLPLISLREVIDYLPTFDIFVLLHTSQKTKKLISSNIRDFVARQEHYKKQDISVRVVAERSYMEVIAISPKIRSTRFKRNDINQALEAAKYLVDHFKCDTDSVWLRITHRKEDETRQIITSVKEINLNITNLQFRHERISSDLFNWLLENCVQDVHIWVLEPQSITVSNWNVFEKVRKYNFQGINFSSHQANMLLKSLKSNNNFVQFRANDIENSLDLSVVFEDTGATAKMDTYRSVVFRPGLTVLKEYKPSKSRFVTENNNGGEMSICITEHAFSFQSN
ncbi:F-box domain-containing protein [Caenorhabditis elegans]|uniref:F-box domain-containing protein n=1 Tax=Caenorhabditis elegans TaxID=6239 RepID=Q9XUM1_CAEEL|nr:F-box domain-containing protein [Caenorhabditis elegans]CAB04905.1 F-box domain-containing protein [Caenorhabditis elegans]|eukprot:NP_493424.1 Uncharacterized protein CELE_W04A8.5 [Caenorhabditis elegans]